MRSWRFCLKTCFEASRVVFWSLLCYKELKLTTSQFTGCTLCGLLIQKRCKISACEVQACTESKISRKFRFLSSPLFSLFLPHFIFSLAVHLVGFVLVGRVFKKTFRILGLGERKGRWAMEQDFHGDFQVNLTWFLLLSPVSLTELCWFWHGLKDLFTLHKLVDKVVLDR